MNIFYEPVNVNQWNIFEKVQKKDHIEPFLATKAMEIGDLLLLHVGSQNPMYQSGIYAYGTVVRGPYILKNSPTDYCNNKNTVDVRIDKLVRGVPLINHDDAKSFIRQFRTVHQIDEKHYPDIKKMLEI